MSWWLVLALVAESIRLLRTKKVTLLFWRSAAWQAPNRVVCRLCDEESRPIVREVSFVKQPPIPDW